MPALLCARCGGPLPAEATDVALACPYCGTTSSPAPKVVERRVEVERVVERVVVRDASGAPASLACLRCGQSMRDTDVASARFSQCPACGGVWLSADAVDRLRRVSDDELRRAVARGEMLALVRPPRTALVCPVCNSAMERLPLAETVHEVDVCRLHGTWFDRTELLAFLDREKTRREGDVTGDDLSAAGVPEPRENAGMFAALVGLFLRS